MSRETDGATQPEILLFIDSKICSSVFFFRGDSCMTNCRKRRFKYYYCFFTVTYLAAMFTAKK